MYAKLALYASNSLWARTDHVFFPISEVCDTVFSFNFKINIPKLRALYFFFLQFQEWFKSYDNINMDLGKSIDFAWGLRVC